MHITEIFKSIQGEGTRAGLPCIFVRLTGCNLRCTWCDTAYAFHGGRKMTMDEVLARVDALSGRANAGKQVYRSWRSQVASRCSRRKSILWPKVFSPRDMRS